MVSQVSVVVAQEQAVGKAEDLTVFECPRCGEAMQHYAAIEAIYPLAIQWRMQCAECGAEQDGWEWREVPARMQGDEWQPDQLLAAWWLLHHRNPQQS
jgi:predicted RNA-binding Zn-ribbon protein involved in translation (DUF1610 family)